MHLTSCLAALSLSSATLVVAQYSDYDYDVALSTREAGYYDSFGLDAREAEAYDYDTDDLDLSLLVRDRLKVTCRGDSKVICDGPEGTDKYCRCTDPPKLQIAGPLGGIPLPPRDLYRRNPFPEVNEGKFSTGLLARDSEIKIKCADDQKVICDKGENPLCHCEAKNPPAKPSRRWLPPPPSPRLFSRDAIADAYQDDIDMSYLVPRRGGGPPLSCSGTADVECSATECHCKNSEKWKSGFVGSPATSKNDGKGKWINGIDPLTLGDAPARSR